MTTASSAVGTGEPEAANNAANAPEPTDANQSAAAESSPAAEASQDANKPKSMLDAVKSALAPAKTEESSASSVKSDATAKPPEGEKPPDVPAKPDDDKPPPFHEHPAWQKRLAKERELTGTIEALTPKAERYDAMQTMMHQNGLSSEEVSAGFNIMALMKNDPAKCLEALRPYVDALEQVTGATLPKDLSERVESGEMTEAAAKEMSRLRADGAAATARAERATQTQAQADQRNAANAMAAEVSKWEGDWQKSDPDYAKKLPLVKAQIIALRQERGAPRTPAEALKLSQDAKAAVDKSLEAVIPQKPAHKAPPKDTSVSAKATPKSMLDAVKQGLEAARAA